MKIYFNSTFNEIVDKRDTSDLWIKGNSGNILYSYFDGLDLSNEFIKCRLVIEWSNGETTNELVMNKSIVRSCFYITLPKLKESGNANFTLRIYIGDELHQTCMFTRNIKESVDASDDTDISNEEYQALLNAVEELSSQAMQRDDADLVYVQKSYAEQYLQEKLVSGLNIKTINGKSLLGAGNIAIAGGTSGGENVDLADYYTKNEIKNNYYNKSEIDSNHLTTDEINNAFITKNDANNKFALSSDLEIAINSINTNRYNLNLVKKGALKCKSLASQTFIFNNTPLGVVTFDKWFNYAVNFTSNGTSYTSISIFMNEVVVEIKFGATSVYTTSSGWSNDAYRTVQFYDGTDIANNDLIIILQCLGSFKSSSGEGVDTYSKEEIDDLLLTKQASLVSGINIKTINGLSILGSGDIVVVGGDGEGGLIVDGELSLTSTNPVQNKTIKEKFDLVDEQINDNLHFIENLTTTVNDKQDLLVSGTNIKTINGNSLLGSGDIVIGGSGESVDLSDYYTKTEADETFALKTVVNDIDERLSDLEIAGGDADLLNYYTKDQTNTLFLKKVDSLPTAVIEGGLPDGYDVGDSVLLKTDGKIYTLNYINEFAPQDGYGWFVLSDFYTKSQADTLFVTQTEADSFASKSSLNNYYTKTAMNTTISGINASIEDLQENSVTTSQMAQFEATMHTTFVENETLENYYTKKDLKTTQAFSGNASTGTLNIDRTTGNGVLIFDCVVTDETESYGTFQLVVPVYDYEITGSTQTAQTLIYAFEGGNHLPCKVVVTYDSSSNKAKFTATNCKVKSAIWCR